MMWPEEGISITTPSTPHSFAFWMSSTMHRAKEKIWAQVRLDDRLHGGLVLWRGDRHPGLDPVDAGRREPLRDRSLSSGVSAIPACCSPSRRVMSWNLTRDGNPSPARDSSWWFHGLVK